MYVVITPIFARYKPIFRILLSLLRITLYLNLIALKTVLKACLRLIAEIHNKNNTTFCSVIFI